MIYFVLKFINLYNYRVMKNILQAKNLQNIREGLIAIVKNKRCKITVFILLLILAIWLRLPLSNFLPMIGDAGEYINAANYLARTGKTFSNFFPATWVYLAIFSKLFGVNGTPYGHLVINILSLISFFYLLKELFPKKEWLRWLGFIMLIFNPLSIWMARMPYSGNLMFVWNINILLFYKKYIKDNSIKNLILLEIFLLLAFLTRVTSTLWIFIIYTDIILRFIKNPTKRKGFHPLILWNSTIITYGITFIYNILIIPDVFLYRYWQKYFNNISPINSALFFLLCWISSNIVLYMLFHFEILQNIIQKAKKSVDKLEKQIKQNKSKKNLIQLGIFTFFILLFIIYLYYSLTQRRGDIENYVMELLFSKKHSLLYIIQEFYLRFNFTYSINYYFSAIAIIPILFGIYKIYTKFSQYSFFIFLATITLIFYSTPTFAKRNHTFYLYYDRYNYPEYFLTLLIFMFYGITNLIKYKYFKVLITTLILGYFLNSIYWLKFNKDFQYLHNITGTMKFINTNTSSEELIVLNRDKNSDYFYPNLERVILMPLELTYGKNIKETKQIQLDPFSTDPKINCNEMSANQDNITILSISTQKNYNLSQICPDIQTKKITEKTFIIKNQEQVYNRFYNPPRKAYIFNILIERPI